MKKNIIKTILFLICLGIAVWLVSLLLCQNSDKDRSYVQMKDFYKQEDNSLDVVALGASDIYAFYQPALAWNECGYTSWNFSASGRATNVNLYTLKEAMKTQPNAVYVIALRRTKTSASSRIHFTTDYMPFSQNKIDLVNYACDTGEEAESTAWDRLEYYLPIIRYHSRWNAMTALDFKFDFPEVKSSSTYETFLEKSEDQSERDFQIEETAKLDKTTEDGFNELLDYIEKENVKVLFVSMPRGNTKTQKEVNTYEKILDERGFDYLRMNELMDEIGLDTSKDYYNKDHTNVHGSIKVTKYIANYISEKYGLEDKRGRSDYKAWDKAADTYKEFISKYLSEDEIKSLK